MTISVSSQWIRQLRTLLPPNFVTEESNYFILHSKHVPDMVTDSSYHNSPRLNSPSKRVTPCYLFVRMGGCDAVLLVCSSDSLFSDLLSLLPSVPRELTLISVNRNVFTVNSLWIFPAEDVLKRPLRQLLNSILPLEDFHSGVAGWHKQMRCVWLQNIILFFLFFYVFCGCWVATVWDGWHGWVFVYCL